MTLRLLSFGPQHWRNGTTFFGRTCCGLIGEPAYDSVRVYKRTLYAEWWYMKQTYFHWLFVNKSEWSAFFGLLPKPDSSHGFPWKETQSRYNQFSEDSPNSDGFGGWYTYILDYIVPRRFYNSYEFLAEHNKERMAYVDGAGEAQYDFTILYYPNFWRLITGPHEYHRYREERFLNMAPDNRMYSVCITLNRKNKFYDHHWRGIGFDTEMS
jgi:hypothetical protein